MDAEARRQAARKGGQTTAAKYGRGYMAEIGRRGAAVTWGRYRLAPMGLSGWAMIDRQSGLIRARIGAWVMG